MPAPPADRTTAGFAVGLAVTGWALFALLGPVALFLTWWGDCPADPCPGASAIERTIYLSDLVAWLAFPPVVVAAYRGWRVGWIAITLVGMAFVAQGLAALLGVRGLNAFAIVLPSALLIAAGGLLGLAPFRRPPG